MPLCGAGEAVADGLTVADDVVADVPVEWVLALAVLRPKAIVAPSAAAPPAVPINGLVILTLLSLAYRGGPG